MTENLFASVVIGLAILGGGYLLAHEQTPLHAPEAKRTIQVASEGRVSVAPDMVVLSLSIQTRSNSSKTAYDQANESVNAAKTILKNAGIAESDIQTTALYLNPEYSYTDGVTRPNGFSATHTLAVKVRNLGNANALLDQVTGVENLQIQSISYDLDKKDPIYQEARKMALEKARLKADEMAKVTGVKVKRVDSISENSTVDTYPRPYQNAMYDMKAGNAESSSSLSTGQLEYTTTVSVIYELE